MNVKKKQCDVCIKSYRDCVWYDSSIDRCKMFKLHDEYVICDCKETLRDFCVWVTKFLKSTVPIGEISADVELLYLKYAVPAEAKQELLNRLLSAMTIV